MGGNKGGMGKRGRRGRGLVKRRMRDDEEVSRESRRKELSNEVGMGLLNSQRYRGLWRETKLYADMPSIRSKIEVGWQAFERALDAKVFRIALLLNGLSEAEAQSRRKDVAGAAALDRSILRQGRRVRIGKANFRYLLDKGLAERRAQYEEIGNVRRDVEERIRKIYLYLEHRREDVETNAGSNALSKIDAFIEDARNERRDQVACFEEGLHHFCRELERVLVETRKGAEKRRSIYDAIADKDKKQQRIIARQYIEISSLCGQVEMMRWKLTSLERATAHQLGQIADESVFFRDLYREKLNNFVRGKNLDKTRASFMSSKYDAIWRYLKELVSRAEHILGLAALCRQYQTEGEKILLPECTFGQGVSVMATQPIFKNIQILYDIHGTATLWHRLAAARSTTWQLSRKKKELASRVSTLRQVIRRRWAERSTEIN